MRILDENNVEIENPDLSLGRLVQDRLLVRHHPAQDAVEEVWHYDYREYPNGGRDAIRVVDVPGVAAKEAWEEYEEIYRFVPYTQAELSEINKPSLEDRVRELEADNEMLLSCLMEMSEMVYA